MKTRRQHAAEDALTISRRSPISIENPETIPMDLIIEILLRLPAKSIGRCRCVSKFWASLLCRKDFTELFLTRSRARPQLLISCESGELFFFSTPQVRNQSLVAVNYHKKFPFVDRSSEMLGPVRGFVCLTHLRKYKKTAPVMYNPSTGQSLPLPYVKTRSVLVKSFLGFDPIDEQFKILSMTSRNYGNYEKHQVLTLGTKKKVSWRKIECCITHDYVRNDGICINGGLYYVAALNGPPRHGIICFDVRSEKFSFIEKDEDMVLWSDSTLVNYKGKLGALLLDVEHGIGEVTGETKCFELWVLVDAEKHEWSKLLYVLPPLWKNIVAAKDKLHFVGLAGTEEIVLSPRYLFAPFVFYVYYYNIESNTVRRVEIQGMDAFMHCEVRISLNYVEDVKPLQYV